MHALSNVGRLPAMLLAFALALAVYASLAAPTVMFADSAEFQTVALTGGIPHSTGYPTFVLMGRLFAHLPLPDRAFRITFMSACFGAGSVALLVLILHEVGIGLVPALMGALLFGSTFTFWRAALRAEVYTLSVFIALLALWRTVVAFRSPSLGPSVLAGFLLGLTLTGHLSFIPPVAVFGLALAWHVFRSRPPALRELAALLGAFLLGLTPYLYLVWADTRNYPYDYLNVVALVSNPLGRPLPSFDTPWERVAWLVTGRNYFPPRPFPVPQPGMLRDVLRGAELVFLFELGPVALVLLVIGFFRQLGRDAGLAILIAVAGAASAGFTAMFADRQLFPIFLLPAVFGATVFVAAGIEPLYAGFAAAARAQGLGLFAPAALALAVVALPPHFLRVYANAHPIGPMGLRVEEEDPTFKPTAVPSLSGFVAGRLYGEQALAAIPPDAIVFGAWPEFANLTYFKVVERRRPDLTLQPMDSKSLRERMVLWQERHAVESRPFVFLSPPPPYPPAGAAIDSLELPSGRRIWVRRAQITEALPAGSAKL